ncbi:MAG: DUF262 domain-containing protein [Prolixibacteraceae bacterium]|nr:DUF262 domain-containing protein [Prolixibacteraceae bacterium]
MTTLTNKIEAHDRSIDEVLNNKKYTVDYFQREFKWEERHIEQLISDLTSTFMEYFRPTHSPKEVANYNSYYLGPFVVSVKDGHRSIIDGQQRLTSLTLFLIYLNHLQKGIGLSKILEPLVFSEMFEEKTFNIQVPEREKCLNELYKKGEYKLCDDDDESTQNMVNRYQDITQSFPEELKNGALSFFIDWLKYRVILVEIIAYSDENAYTIFETMNDRGLNLTPAEMLKGFILSKFTDKDNKKRQKANELWKESMQKLHIYDKDEDQRFFQSWLRAQYAVTIRPGKAESKNEDFEKIGTRFHSWFRENLDKIGLGNEKPESFELFIEKDFKFFLKQYLTIKKSEQTFNASLEYIYYINRWGIADSLRYPLLLAPLNKEDDDELIIKKMNLVARYIETFVVRRSLNFRLFAASSIRYTMYSLVKEIRNKNLLELTTILKGKLDSMEETIDGMTRFRLHGQNAWFIKFLLSRMTSFVERQAGDGSTFEKYYYNPGGKPFEIEHIWADSFEDHKDEFDQETEFIEIRNRIGALLLLPRGTNQSYGKKPYSEKIAHYIKENLLAKTLCEGTYLSNPNFLNMKEALTLPFKPHTQFKKQDIAERQNLYKEICKRIWSWE